MLEHLGILCFTVYSSDSVVFLEATASFFPCVTDSHVSNHCKFATGWKLCFKPLHLLVHCTLKCQQCQLTWPESFWGVCLCKPSQQCRKAGFTPFLFDCGYGRIVHHHLYEKYLNLMGRILLKHWLILPTHFNFWRAMVWDLQTYLLGLPWGLNRPHMLQDYGQE